MQEERGSGVYFLSLLCFHNTQQAILPLRQSFWCTGKRKGLFWGFQPLCKIQISFNSSWLAEVLMDFAVRLSRAPHCLSLCTMSGTTVFCHHFWADPRISRALLCPVPLTSQFLSCPLLLTFAMNTSLQCCTFSVLFCCPSNVASPYIISHFIWKEKSWFFLCMSTSHIAPSLSDRAFKPILLQCSPVQSLTWLSSQRPSNPEKAIKQVIFQ